MSSRCYVSSPTEVDCEESRKYHISIDFSDIDRDLEKILIVIPRCDGQSHTVWMQSYNEILTEIEDKLHNKEWHESCNLLFVNTIINKLDDFVDVFTNQQPQTLQSTHSQSSLNKLNYDSEYLFHVKVKY